MGPVFLCPSEPTGRPRRPSLFGGRVLVFRILWDLRGWASKDRVATPRLNSSKFVQNFTEVGCLALGSSGIGRAGFPKTRWPPLFSLLCTLEYTLSEFETHH